MIFSRWQSPLNSNCINIARAASVEMFCWTLSHLPGQNLTHRDPSHKIILANACILSQTETDGPTPQNKIQQMCIMFAGSQPVTINCKNTHHFSVTFILNQQLEDKFIIWFLINLTPRHVLLIMFIYSCMDIM